MFVYRFTFKNVFHFTFQKTIATEIQKRPEWNAKDAIEID